MEDNHVAYNTTATSSIIWIDMSCFMMSLGIKKDIGRTKQKRWCFLFLSKFCKTKHFNFFFMSNFG